MGAMNPLGIPIRSIIEMKKGHSRESNAFSASKRTAAAGTSRLILCNTENTVLKFNDVDQRGTMPDCTGEITNSMGWAIRSVIILAKIL